MSSKVIGIYRKNLRHAIFAQYPTLSSKDIYKAIKNPNLPDLFFEDLSSFCEKLEIPMHYLSDIFASYKISSNRISEEKFIKFIEDEVSCKSIPKNLPPNITDEQIAILNKFATAIRNHRTQAMPSKKAGLSSERPSYSQQWVFLTRMNSTKSISAKLRVSSILHFCEEVNLAIPPEQFIDSLFTFFEEKLDAITFQQFTHIMETF